MLRYFAIAKVILHEKPKVDNLVFYLHYRITFFIYVIASLFVTACGYYGGKAINCLNKGVPSNVINTYCYFTSTYTIPRFFNTSLTNRPDSIPYPGVGFQSPTDDVVYHKYYQWVSFHLFLLGLMAYSPYYLWKCLEGGVFRTVLGGLEKFNLDDSRREKINVLVSYMLEHWTLHKMWAFRFFVCEALNLANVIGHIYFIDYFLGGTFLNYGTEVLSFPDMDSGMRVDPMTRIFPKMTKCTFRKYGASGTLETHDAFCVLAANIINEKIYIFLWFWLIALSVITAVWIVFRIFTILFSPLRNRMLSLRGRWAGEHSLKVITDRCQLGDWFLIYQLGVHMEPGVYGEFLKELAAKLESNMGTIERKPMLAN